MTINGEQQFQLDPMEVIRVFEQMFPKELQIAMLIVRNKQLEELLARQEGESL